MDRFWQKVDRSAGPESCWLWTGGRDKDGYGKVRFDGKHMRAHRVALFLATGQWGAQACHTCDTPECCNSAHLYWGNNTANMRDRAARTWRTPRGERNHRSKLTSDMVQQMRARHTTGAKLRELAAEFSVSEATVCLVVNRKTWSHV